LLVTEEEFLAYQAFAEGVAKKLGFNTNLPEIIWHYTTADGLLGVLDSGSLFATQLACLNDQSELRYAVFMVRSAMQLMRLKPGEDPDRDYIFDFLDRAAMIDVLPNSELFVACFSRNGDELSQWRAYGGGENGYAIAFRTQALFSHHSVVAPVSYDHALHLNVAGEVAAAFVDFYLRGARRGHDRQEWTIDFTRAWDAAMGRVGAMIKHPAFTAEAEFRCIHKLEPSEHGSLEFRQKAGMLSRYLPLYFPPLGKPREKLLPIEGVIVGPCRHSAVSKASVEMLLRKHGYPSAVAEVSSAPFQMT